MSVLTLLATAIGYVILTYLFCGFLFLIYMRVRKGPIYWSVALMAVLLWPIGLLLLKEYDQL